MEINHLPHGGATLTCSATEFDSIADAVDVAIHHYVTLADSLEAEGNPEEAIFADAALDTLAGLFEVLRGVQC